MPFTSTSGYTFPVAGVPTTQTPNSGSPAGSSAGLRPYSDFNGDWFAYLQYMAAHGDDASLDRLLNYFMNENSADIARRWTAQREDTQYQRLVADLRAAGINPYILLNGNATPISSSSSGSSYSGNYVSSAAMKEASNNAKWASVLTSFLSAMAFAVIALI